MGRLELTVCPCIGANYSLHAINVRQSKINTLIINTMQNIFNLNLRKWVKLYYICTIQLRNETNNRARRIIYR